jgi:hypothetical protein
MPRYRLRVIDPADHLLGRFDLANCLNDADAIAAALSDFPDHALDLWEGDRLVETFMRSSRR